MVKVGQFRDVTEQLEVKYTMKGHFDRYSSSLVMKPRYCTLKDNLKSYYAN